MYGLITYPVFMDQIMVLAMGFPICLVVALYLIDAVKAVLRGIF